jgi:hypothetical protein
MIRNALVPSLVVLWLGGCALPEGRTEESEARRTAYCQDLSRQIAELSNRPVRRTELRRRYDEECTR